MGRPQEHYVWMDESVNKVEGGKFKFISMAHDADLSSFNFIDLS